MTPSPQVLQSGPSRRGLIVPFAALIVAGAIEPATARAVRRGALDPRTLGARGDGHSDDTAALTRALASGRPVDGGGRTYGVSGWLRAGPRFRGLANCTLRQLEPTDRNRTLYIAGARDFRLANVAVMRNGRNDDGFVQRDMMDNAGVWLQDCSGFELDRVRISGGGVGTGLVMFQCSGFTASDCNVSHIIYRRRERPRDDFLQGMWINRCRDFELVRPVVSDLGGVDGQGSSRDNNRAIALGGCSRFRIRELNVSSCGQGLDLTGTEGNRDFMIVGGHAADCFTWGFKFANSAQMGKVTGALAERCGLGGFVVSGRSEMVEPPPQQIDIQGCRAFDCGDPARDNTKFGFGVLRSRPDPDYPRRVRFIDCVAADRRPRRGMKWGFFNEIQAPAAERNTVTRCTVAGATEAPFYGFA